MRSKQVEYYFQQIEQSRTTFYQFIKDTVENPFERPQRDKWSAAETIYHLILMIRLVRRFTNFYFPMMLPYATIRKKHPYKTEIHNIYEEYRQIKKKSMKAPFILTPPKQLYQKYNFTELQELLNQETSRLRNKLSSIDEAVLGQVRYPDPIAYYPNMIQSIQLLAIHEAHHFKLTRKYELQKKMNGEK